MARMSVPRWSVYVVAAALIASLSFSLGSIYSAFGESHEATFYACLYAGSLSQVGTTPPANCGRGSQISWNSEGLQGPPGPAGATNVVERTGPGFTVPAGGSFGGSASCEEGEVATGGGWDGVLDTTKASNNGPISDINGVPYGWFAQLQNPSTSNIVATVSVICASP